jgi:hypothetical protein
MTTFEKREDRLGGRAQDGLDTHSLRKFNALRHTCQLKFQTG